MRTLRRSATLRGSIAQALQQTIETVSIYSAELQRKSITRIWNHADQYKLGILWEYTSPAAYQKCQKVIAKRILPIAHRYEMMARAYRGVPIIDWRSDDASGLTVEGNLAQGKDQSRYLADSANAGDNETH